MPQDVSFNRDGTEVMLSNGSLSGWNLKNGDLVHKIHIYGHGNLKFFQISEVSNKIYLVYEDGHFFIYDLEKKDFGMEYISQKKIESFLVIEKLGFIYTLTPRGDVDT